MSDLTMAVRGDVETLDAAAERTLFARATTRDAAVRDMTAGIIGRVRERGDAALAELARELDGAGLRDGWSIEVPRAACDAALARLDPAVRRAMQRAADNIRDVHEAFRPLATEFGTADGVCIGRRPDPLARVGVYAPGGRAAYPSSLLMGAIPARVAGVREVIACSPPAGDGRPSGVVLAAAALAGVDRLFAVGGAGAIAAMAYGTRSVPAVDRIVGPGNAYVTEAKLQVSSEVGIDSPAGPSELLVLADDSADPRHVAREMLAQAEHDPLAAVVLVTTSKVLARAVDEALVSRIATAARARTMRAAFAARGGILTAASMDAAVAFVSRWAPEHLLMLVGTVARARVLGRLRHCGTIFLGDGASVAFGDYMTGANHVLPTGGAARTWSGLSTQDFVRWTTWQRIDGGAAARMGGDTAALAEAEGLPAHAAAGAAFARSSTTAASSTTIARAGLDGIPPHAPAASPGVDLDLRDNVNLWGAPPSARNTLRDTMESSLLSYPTPGGGELAAALACSLRVQPDEIVVGCGSDDVIDSFLRAVASPGDSIAFAEPTFSMIPVFARLNGLVPRPVPLRADGAADVDGLLATGARVIYLCSPNNPTGTVTPVGEVLRLVAHAPGVVLVDEAYAEFARLRDWRAEAPAMQRVLITRTFSKAWGLAGLRVGGRDLVAAVARARGPYKVNSLAERCAIAALREDQEWMRRTTSAARESRDRLQAAFHGFDGVKVWDAHGNFVFLEVGERAPALQQAFRDCGIGVRVVDGVGGVGAALRIGVGPRPLMDRVITAARRLLPAGAAACA